MMLMDGSNLRGTYMYTPRLGVFTIADVNYSKWCLFHPMVLTACVESELKGIW